METAPLLELVHSLGSQWLSLVFLVGYLVHKSGLVHRLIGIQASERRQLSADQQKLFDNLQAELGRLARERVADRAECEDRLAELRRECDREMKRLNEEIGLLIKGESRWRHLVANLAEYVAALQNALRKTGIEVPRFGGWEKFIAEGGDPLLSMGSGE